MLWKRGKTKAEAKMGAKASTNGNQSPRTFSNSSSSDVVSGGNHPTSFNFLRAIHGVEVANDSRQRARSMSSVPDIQSAGTNHHHHHPNAYSNHPTHNSQPYSHVDVNGFQNSGAGGGPQVFDLSSAGSDDVGNHDDNGMLQGINALGLGRVYTAASLPSHIWSINGEQTTLISSGMCVSVCAKERFVQRAANRFLIYSPEFLSTRQKVLSQAMWRVATTQLVARFPPFPVRRFNVNACLNRL